MRNFYGHLKQDCEVSAKQLRKYSKKNEWFYEAEFVALVYHRLLKRSGYSPNCLNLENYYDQELQGKRSQKHADMIFTQIGGLEEVVEVKPIWVFRDDEQLQRENSKRVLGDYKKLATLNFKNINAKYLVVPYLGEDEFRPIKFRRAVKGIFPQSKLGYNIELITC
jgi:hypothetical protein